MQKLGVKVIVPLTTDEGIIGFLILGEKLSGDMYTVEDIKLLEIFVPEMTMAIKNAQSYSKIVKDRERIKNLLNERKELDKMKSDFIAISCHEVNTPISIIEGYLSLLLKGDGGKLNKKAKEYVDKAFQGTKRVGSLMNSLLNASKIGQGRLVIETQPVDLEGIIKKAIRMFSVKAKDKKVRLFYDKTKNLLPYVKVDPYMIQEVFSQLLDNALKFTPKGSIIVSAKASEDKVNIKVKDSGIGISKKHLPHIFDKFYQVDSSYTRGAQGVGLGLFIVKSIIGMHKGKIRVKSELGLGTEVEIILNIK